MHEVHARIYPNDKRKRHLAHTVIYMDDIAGIDDYKERRTGEV